MGGISAFFFTMFMGNEYEEQIYHVYCEAVLRWFICYVFKFIPNEHSEKAIIPYIYNASNKALAFVSTLI